jgi:hypothetical protein
MTHYYEGYVRARRSLDAHARSIDHTLTDEISVRQPMRFRVGLSLVSLGNQLMGNPADGSGIRRAA